MDTIGKAKKILIIEHDLSLREALAELLSLEGYEVFETENGYLGLQLAKKHLPDLILCSRMFADINCWDVLRALKEDETTKQIPFIFLSSKPIGEEHQKMEKNKDVIVLIKPFSIEKLKKTIQECLFLDD